MQDDIHQNLRQIGPNYSQTDEKQRQVVQMIKRMEIKPEMRTRVNLDIPGLRKKKTPFSATPNNKRLWDAFSSFERNGMINVGLSRNIVRLLFPTVPVFFFIYMMQPIIHGTVNIQHYNNYSYKTVYHKFQQEKIPYTDNTITRIA